MIAILGESPPGRTKVRTWPSWKPRSFPCPPWTKSSASLGSVATFQSLEVVELRINPFLYRKKWTSQLWAVSNFFFLATTVFSLSLSRQYADFQVSCWPVYQGPSRILRAWTSNFRTLKAADFRHLLRYDALLQAYRALCNFGKSASLESEVWIFPFFRVPRFQKELILPFWNVDHVKVSNSSIWKAFFFFFFFENVRSLLPWRPSTAVLPPKSLEDGWGPKDLAKDWWGLWLVAAGVSKKAFSIYPKAKSCRGRELLTSIGSPLKPVAKWGPNKKTVAEFGWAFDLCINWRAVPAGCRRMHRFSTSRWMQRTKRTLWISIHVFPIFKNPRATNSSGFSIKHQLKSLNPSGPREVGELNLPSFAGDLQVRGPLEVGTNLVGNRSLVLQENGPCLKTGSLSRALFNRWFSPWFEVNVPEVRFARHTFGGPEKPLFQRSKWAEKLVGKASILGDDNQRSLVPNWMPRGSCEAQKELAKSAITIDWGSDWLKKMPWLPHVTWHSGRVWRVPLASGKSPRRDWISTKRLKSLLKNSHVTCAFLIPPSIHTYIRRSNWLKSPGPAGPDCLEPSRPFLEPGFVFVTSFGPRPRRSLRKSRGVLKTGASTTWQRRTALFCVKWCDFLASKAFFFVLRWIAGNGSVRGKACLGTEFYPQLFSRQTGHVQARFFCQHLGIFSLYSDHIRVNLPVLVKSNHLLAETVSDFSLGKTLGTGAFGRVRRGPKRSCRDGGCSAWLHLSRFVTHKGNGRHYALKTLKKAAIIKMKQVRLFFHDFHVTWGPGGKKCARWITSWARSRSWPSCSTPSSSTCGGPQRFFGFWVKALALRFGSFHDPRYIYMVLESPWASDVFSCHHKMEPLQLWSSWESWTPAAEHFSRIF